MLIAICGTIGSGKSAVCSCIRGKGYAVFSADEINRELLKDKEYIKRIEKAFSAHNIVKDGAVDKSALRRLISYDDGARAILEGIAHPMIKERILGCTAGLETAFVEVPLLDRSGFRSIFDRIWFVTADEGVRLKRITARDGITRELAEKFVALQRAEEKLMRIADCIIENNGTYIELCERIERLLEKL